VKVSASRKASVICGRARTALNRQLTNPVSPGTVSGH
jgi:hypothetical protein